MGVIVTGATGHLGYNIVKKLRHSGQRVFATYRKQSSSLALKSLAQMGVDLIALDLERNVEEKDLKDLKDLKKQESVNAIIHCAAGFTYDINKETKLIDQNNTICRNVAYIAHSLNVKKIVATSSIGAVGLESSRHELLDETQWYLSQVPYLRSKYESEKNLKSLCKKYRISLTTLCPTTIIGPGFFQLTPSLKLIKDIIDNRFKVIPPLSCNFIDVRDLAQCHIEAQQCRFDGRYVLGQARPISLKNVIALIQPFAQNLSGPHITLPRKPFVMGLRGGLKSTQKAIDILARRQTQIPYLEQLSASLCQLNEFFAGELWLDLKAAKLDLNYQPRFLAETLQDTIKALTQGPEAFNGERSNQVEPCIWRPQRTWRF